MRLPRRLGNVFLLCCLSGSLCFTGCKGSDDGGKGSGGTKRIIILTNGNSPYWDACRVGLQQAEKELKLKDSGLTAVLEVNNGTPSGQLDKLRQFASQSDIAAVGISAIDASNVAIADQLRDLQKAGIKVITIDSDVDRVKFREVRTAYLGTDNYAGGLELGKCVKGLKPSGAEYVAFVGKTGAQNAMDRINGLKAGAGADCKWLDTMADDMELKRARENVRNAITNHPTLNVLVGIWSYNAPAIADVVEEKGLRNKYTIVVFDAEPGAIKSMEKGMIDAMVVQNPYEMGFQGVRLLKALVKDDQATVKAMLPKLGEKEGDILDTGLRVVVPDDSTSLKADMFDKGTEFMKLGKFREWLSKFNLTGS